MASKHDDRPTLHALLIAADCYLPNRLPEGSYPNLGGCVRDVQLVEDFLRDRLLLKEDRLVKLTSTNVGDQCAFRAAGEVANLREHHRGIQGSDSEGRPEAITSMSTTPATGVALRPCFPRSKGKAASTRPSSRSTSATPRPAMSGTLKWPSSFRTWSPRG